VSRSRLHCLAAESGPLTPAPGLERHPPKVYPMTAKRAGWSRVDSSLPSHSIQRSWSAERMEYLVSPTRLGVVSAYVRRLASRDPET